MSYIISAGNKKPQWVPAKKTAQIAGPIEAPVEGVLDGVVDAAPQEEDASPFFDAIKGLESVKEQASSLEQAIETATEAVEAVKEVALSEGVIQPKSVGATPVAAPPPAIEAPAAPAVEAPGAEAPKVEEKVEEKIEAPKAEEKKEGNPFAEKKEDAPKSEEKPEEKKEVDSVEIENPRREGRRRRS